MFLLHSTDDDRQQPWEYLPCSAMTPKYGMAMLLSSGKLAKASGSATPEYICVREEAASVAAGTVIPVIKIQKDQVFETTGPSSALTVGTGYDIGSDGLSIASTTSGGAFVLLSQDGTNIRGRFA